MYTSKLIQGCMTWGRWGKQLSTSQMASQIEDCLSLGVTTFDHADIYGDYTTEAEFGIAFTESKIKRESIQLISKCGLQLSNSARNNRVKHYQYDSEYIIAQVEQSISNLNCDYLDAFLLHRPSPLMDLQEIAKSIIYLKEQGKIKHFGVSNFTAQQIDLLSAHVEVEGHQLQCSLNYCKPFTNDILQHHLSKQILTMAWSPLGSLHRLHEDNLPLDKVLGEMATRYECEKAQLAIAFLNKHPVGIRSVVGTTQPKRLEALKEALAMELSLQDWFLILEASRGHEVD
ncbi:oxidoreductase, aldo/keto reductase family [Psychroflexus torquis ATCC 700755]|uniref:Oxidoreductase, aldo/keto reductase family n=1 Tax=Psychroflexus torquis (strain ATCC 700755 / CIP 106069 / ACAM 623) TaxID=313595 RepID=K4IF35_PSYTT|nr:aldo/keto reductase [Psychroflexus torquis]AFU68453.1 oxidoreductase, aldo/keto reductase family [Psychroflexus torquis ATCC 700755]